MNQFNKILSRILLTSSLLVFLACSPKAPSISGISTEGAQNILGGENADSNFQKQNGVVGLLIVSNNPGSKKTGAPTQSEAICTGSLISKRTVLTAAHCLINPNMQMVVVTFETDIKQAVQNHHYILAQQIKVSELFKPTSAAGPFAEGQPWNDVGLIQLKSDAPTDFQFAQLPSEEDLQYLDNQTHLTLAGFGVTTPIVNQVKDVNGRQVVVPVKGPSDTAGVLRFVHDVVVTDATPDHKEIEVDQQNGLRGACHGDSGGPAYLYNPKSGLKLIGITSRGTDLNGNCDQQNVFTNVYGQLDWIKATLALF